MAIQDYLQRGNEHDCVTQVYKNQKNTSSTETIVVNDFLDFEPMLPWSNYTEKTSTLKWI